ncbi:MAG: DUF2203 domain-containing protein [Chloroflexi bacterium]|nr:DUF2203 domain-containing protein [Chloroflexota bacterium]
MPKYYTPQEANEALSIVGPILIELMEISGKIRANQPEYWTVVQKSAGNGGSPALSKLLPDFDRLDALLHKIQDMGIEVKDLTIGLIDFVAYHDGREIYLCWKFGEDKIQFWHEINEGFQGRQLINWE